METIQKEKVKLTAKVVSQEALTDDICSMWIQADEIETLILDPEKIDPAETEIICPTVGEKLDKAPEA